MGSLADRALPCYRCGKRASTEYMGLAYCPVCRDVIVATLPGLRGEPPFGFPGSSGYLPPVPGEEDEGDKPDA